MDYGKFLLLALCISIMCLPVMWLCIAFVTYIHRYCIHGYLVCVLVYTLLQKI